MGRLLYDATCAPSSATRDRVGAPICGHETFHHDTPCGWATSGIPGRVPPSGVEIAISMKSPGIRHRAEFTTTSVDGQLQRIYYYITLACNLRCAHCYVGDHIGEGRHANAETVLRNLAKYRAQGARELVLLGGEPTLHPAYQRIVIESVRLGYSRLVVDTNGCARSPLVHDPRLAGKLTVRLSFEGIGVAQHDAIRGQGAFSQAIVCLRSARAAGIRTEVTFTVHAGNYGRLRDVVDFFAREQIAELNFHFVSVMGKAAERSTLALSGAMVLAVQEQLDHLRTVATLPLRYPRLLVTEEDWQHELKRGLRCRREARNTLLLLPNESTCHCPLQIPARLGSVCGEQSAPTSGCMLVHRLLPAGVPHGYRATCISWK